MPRLALKRLSSSAPVLQQHLHVPAKGFGTKPSLKLTKNSLVSNREKISSDCSMLGNEFRL